MHRRRTGRLDVGRHLLVPVGAEDSRVPAFKADGLLVITSDEGPESDVTACCGEASPGGGRIGALLLGPSITPGTTSSTPHNHYGLLCSVEDLFGLSHLGKAATPGMQCFGSDVYGAS